MSNRVWLSIIAALVGLAVWHGTHKQGDLTQVRASAPKRVAGADLSQASAQFAKTLAESEQLLRGGEFMPCASKLGQQFPPFEMRLMNDGFKEIQPGVTLRDWFDKEQTRFTSVLQAELPRFVEAVKAGDASWRDLEAFLHQMPFPFVNQLRRSYESEQRQAVAQARVQEAANWCLVSVIAVSGSGAGYERRVRDVLRQKWSDGPGLKLVFDSPMSPQERRAASKVIAVEVKETFSEYRFEGNASQRGSGRVPEKAVIKFADLGSRPNSVHSSWDGFTLTVTNAAPDWLRFKFSNERQKADFSDIEAAQRQALEDRLAAALGALPMFELQ